MRPKQQQIIKEIEKLSVKHSSWKVFSDFVEVAAITISNAVDKTKWREREDRYLAIVKEYGKDEFTAFKKMFHLLIGALDETVEFEGGPKDILGPIFHELALHNKWKGQFFTPIDVSELIGKMNVRQLKPWEIERLNEPCAGSGSMVLGYAKAMRENNMNYNRQLLVTAQDVDIKCVHMTYIQLSLYGIPAVVLNANTLTLEVWDTWYTPIYLIDGWKMREKGKDYLIKPSIEGATQMMMEI